MSGPVGRAYLAWGLTLCLAAATALPAAAGGDAQSGRALAEKLCSGCHIVSSTSAGATVSADVPSFAAIANKADQSSERIAGRIVVPHPPMPQIELARREIADLAAYIMSLRSD